ncbi:AMP-binding protein, partial [Rhizobiaceae sp. 2RAB30]
MQITQFVRQATTLNPQGTATVYGERRRSWTEFAERTARLAAALKKLGLATDDFVAVLSMNSDRYVELFYAIPHAGGCFAPMNVRWSKAENAYALRDCGAKVLFVGTDFVSQARDLARELQLETLIYMGEGDTPEDMLSYEDLIAASDPAE